MAKNNIPFEDTHTPAMRRAVRKFKRVFLDQAATLDAEQVFDWHDVGFGFFLACGLDDDAADTLAGWVKWDCNFFQD